VAESGTRRELLEASRDTLKGLLAGAEPNTAPALSRELRAVLVELESIPAAAGQSKQDELKERRNARLAEAAARARSAESK
jgi:hypothetical protein